MRLLCMVLRVWHRYPPPEAFLRGLATAASWWRRSRVMSVTFRKQRNTRQVWYHSWGGLGTECPCGRSSRPLQPPKGLSEIASYAGGCIQSAQSLVGKPQPKFRTRQKSFMRPSWTELLFCFRTWNAVGWSPPPSAHLRLFWRKKNNKFYFRTKHRTRKNSSVS